MVVVAYTSIYTVAFILDRPRSRLKTNPNPSSAITCPHRTNKFRFRPALPVRLSVPTTTGSPGQMISSSDLWFRVIIKSCV